MALSTRKPVPIAQANPRSSFAESYRTIRTNIEFSMITAHLKTVLITSSNPGEGKTSTAANLAVVFAQAGKRVLLMDADMRTPQLHHRFHVSGDTGLSNLLTQDDNLHEVICTTEVPGLCILPGGQPTTNASSLLSSLNFASVMGRCKTKFDLVIIDSPPVLEVSDALVITRSVDGVVFVVDAKRTNRMVAQRALATIRQVNGNILGGVLNRIPRTNKKSYCYGSATPTIGVPIQE